MIGNFLILIFPPLINWAFHILMASSYITGMNVIVIEMEVAISFTGSPTYFKGYRKNFSPSVKSVGLVQFVIKVANNKTVRILIIYMVPDSRPSIYIFRKEYEYNISPLP